MLGPDHNPQLLLSGLQAEREAELLGACPLRGDFSARSWQKKSGNPALDIATAHPVFSEISRGHRPHRCAKIITSRRDFVLSWKTMPFTYLALARMFKVL